MLYVVHVCKCTRATEEHQVPSSITLYLIPLRGGLLLLTDWLTILLTTDP